MTCHAACIASAPRVERGAIARTIGGPLVVACHGILTNTTDLSWCDKFDQYAWAQNPTVKVILKEYWAWPIPAVNVWIRNHILARSLAKEIYGFAQEGARPISIVAHSNGCDIAIRTAHRLSALGVKLRSLVMIAGACEADIIKSGLFALISGGGLSRATAYCSKHDLALCSRLIWPFGRLGFTGWQLAGDGFSDARIVTRWFQGYSHGEYFHADNLEKTFDQVWRDCGLPYAVPLGGAR